ncbi:hypothetical protein [uncultured Formosa sp.]|uniref:hypothetical protein n=1 Tax=uncultured Formosa sp. TaxID=255435 RepID=UPI00262067B3|nr:hypothetical protein [uncultured Formosa sp.]
MKVNYKLDRFFTLMFLIIGITLLICGLIFIGRFNLEDLLLGLFLIINGTIIVFTRYGTLIDFNEKKIKHYVGFFFIKIGFWKSFKEYPFISVLHFNQKSVSYSRTAIPFHEKKKIYRICLLNATHSERLKIKDFSDFKSASSEAKRIEKTTSLERVVYNPVKYYS